MSDPVQVPSLFCRTLTALSNGSTLTKKLEESINYLHISIMKRVACPPGNRVSPTLPQCFTFPTGLKKFSLERNVFTVHSCRLEVWDGFLLNMRDATFRGRPLFYLMVRVRIFRTNGSYQLGWGWIHSPVQKSFFLQFPAISWNPNLDTMKYHLLSPLKKTDRKRFNSP